MKTNEEYLEEFDPLPYDERITLRADRFCEIIQDVKQDTLDAVKLFSANTVKEMSCLDYDDSQRYQLLQARIALLKLENLASR